MITKFTLNYVLATVAERSVKPFFGVLLNVASLLKKKTEKRLLSDADTMVPDVICSVLDVPFPIPFSV